MESLAIHRAASAGSLIKKILAINPDLGVREISMIIRQATSKRTGVSKDYTDVEVIDEKQALDLAKQLSNR